MSDWVRVAISFWLMVAFFAFCISASSDDIHVHEALGIGMFWPLVVPVLAARGAWKFIKRF